MQKTRQWRALGIFTVLGLAAVVVGVMATPKAPLQAEEEPSDGPQVVDESMHHFMEYVFEPNYKRLKAQMATAPKDRAAWKAVKGDALTLAECSNLLLSRAPEKDASQWRKLSIAVRTHGGQLYQAARKSDYETAKTAYVTMLNNCNACHQKFADGKHQLKP